MLWGWRNGGEDVMGKCDHTQTGRACCWWLPAQTGWWAVGQTGPALHLQSKCLVHCTGISCAASPSSGLGHLKIHGCLKQKTATQFGCYATDQEESGTSFPSSGSYLVSYSTIENDSNVTMERIYLYTSCCAWPDVGEVNNGSLSCG